MEEKGHRSTPPSSVPCCLFLALLPVTQDPGQSWGDSHFLWLVPIPTPSVWPFAESPVASAYWAKGANGTESGCQNTLPAPSV